MSELKKKYDKIFTESFSIGESDLTSNPAYNKISNWDSIGHMGLISALEDAFGISMEADDIVNFSSYQKGVEIMAKYDVQLQ